MMLYLHGFNSSPLSGKAAETAQYCAARGIACAVPALHHRPAEAARQMEKLVEEGDIRLVVGSSMGGFYATWLCERHPQLRAVLINPAVRISELLAGEEGKTQKNFHTNEEYLFTADHVREFREMEVERVADPSRYLLMAQTGDELLDYRQAEKFYAGCSAIIERGGDHMFAGYARHLAAIVDFAQRD